MPPDEYIQKENTVQQTLETLSDPGESSRSLDSNDIMDQSSNHATNKIIKTAQTENWSKKINYLLYFARKCNWTEI